MTVFYWHIHHNILVEPLTEPIEARIDYIKTQKPEHERETRLRLLKPVLGLLPASLLKVGAAYDKAGAAYDKAVAVTAAAAYLKAEAAYDKAEAAYRPEIEALHAQECPDCPWNGWTIFPESAR